MNIETTVEGLASSSERPNIAPSSLLTISEEENAPSWSSGGVRDLLLVGACFQAKSLPVPKICFLIHFPSRFILQIKFIEACFFAPHDHVTGYNSHIIIVPVHPKVLRRY
jgi:hypothetical protein